MRNEVIASLLIAVTLISSSPVSALTPVSRGASSEYKWATAGKGVKVPIFSTTVSRGPVWVLVHVEAKNEKKDETGGIFLDGCGSRFRLIVPRGQTIECRVRPGGHLIAESKETCVETGTLQLVGI